MPADQLAFPFASLDFPGRSTVMLSEIAEKLGVSHQHLLNEIDEGTFVGIDLKGKGATKRCIRIPLEIYHRFILSRLTGPLRGQFLRDLPVATRRQLLRELQESLR